MFYGKKRKKACKDEKHPKKPCNFNEILLCGMHDGGFITTKTDLVKKDCNFVSKLQSFFGAGDRT